MMKIPDIDPSESEEEFLVRLRRLGVWPPSAKRAACKQHLLRCLNAGTTHAELVSVVRRLVDYL